MQCVPGLPFRRRPGDEARDSSTPSPVTMDVSQKDQIGTDNLLAALDSVSLSDEPSSTTRPEVNSVSTELEEQCNDGDSIAELVQRILHGLAGLSKRTKWRKDHLLEMLDLTVGLKLSGAAVVTEMLSESHNAFAIEEDEHGDTDLIQFEINTGDKRLIRQPPWRIPFAVHRDVSKKLVMMLCTGVIQPSQSPRASPIVLIRKKDGSLHFCIDYRLLNAITRSDQFPLPQIHNVLEVRENPSSSQHFT